VDLLTIDCGNSTIDCRRDVDGLRMRFDAQAVAAGELARFVAPEIRRCVIVSVAPTSLTIVQETLRERAVESRIAGVDVPCPLPLAYDTPATLGADRWVGALAAHREHGRAVVVDCGSATTVNLVDADGTFRGGAIAPGLRALVVGMAAATPALPAPDLTAVPRWPPRTTQDAVDTRVVLGWCGMVERLVAAAIAGSHGPATVVVTGGNAERLLAHGRLRAVHVPDLVHRGLGLLAASASWTC
jgi:type III pantothenate kinase